MRVMARIGASMAMGAILLASLAFPALAQQTSGRRVAETFAHPALAALADSADRLGDAADALCAAPGEHSLAAAREAFAETVQDWGRASVLRFGPLAADSRFERIFFWPDARGIALRQVQKLLAEEDGDAIAADGLAGKSAALRGFPALEFVLHGTGSDELARSADFRCRYGAAIARNIAAIASATLEGWRSGTGFADSFADPRPGTEPYRSAAEVDGEIVKALTTILQYVRAAELLPALGDSPEKANGKRAPLWRSRLTFRLIEAQVRGARDLLAAAGYETSLPDDAAWMPQSIRFELETTARMLNEIATAPEAAFGDGEDRGRLTVADLSLDHAGHLVSEQLSNALGLTMGFNALDGD